MKLFAPSYYKDFACIADRCQHSCCVGWEIDIDPDTLAHYETMTHPYGEAVRNSISYQDDPHFALTAGDRCPHLNENGLCKLIIEAGESSLCEICREHPRFYHATAKGMEVGLGMSCEEACRLILSSDGYDAFYEVTHEDCDPEKLFFDALPRRDTLYRILSHETFSHSAKLEEIGRLYDVSPCNNTDDFWRAQLVSLEYLTEAHKELFACYQNHTEPPADCAKPLERALAYFIFRHCTPAESYEEFRAALGFCLLCERLLASMATKHPKLPIADLARILSAEIEYSTENTDTIKSVFY